MYALILLINLIVLVVLIVLISLMIILSGLIKSLIIILVNVGFI